MKKTKKTKYMLGEVYASIPALKKKMSVEQMIRIAKIEKAKGEFKRKK